MIVRRDIESSPYKILQEQALRQIQELSGNRWTDFNEHDPGVTILDALNYALLELQYMFRFPFESYLAGKDQKIDFDRLGLFPAGELFAPAIVTTADYEKLIVDSVKGVKACRVTLQPDHHYSIEAECDEPDNEHAKGHWQVVSQIEQLYHAHRNLCENLESVRIGKLSKEKERRFLREDIEYEKANGNPGAQAVFFSENYYSVQNHFPDCYGINEKGMPAGANSETRAKIRQLQGYLLIFDRLLAYTKHQVANIPSLLELSGNVPSDGIPELETDAAKTLLDKERCKENKVCDTEFWQMQKLHYLDMLDRLYGENTKRFFANERDLATANRKRAELIRQLPQLNEIRFRSFNILKKDEACQDMPGILQFLAAINGRQPDKDTSVVNLFSRYNLRLLGDEEFRKEYKNLNMAFITGYDERRFFDYQTEAIPVEPVAYQDHLFHLLQDRIYLFRHHLLFETFLKEGSKPENYKMIHWHKASGYLLIFEIPGKQEWFNLGFFDTRQMVIETANLLWRFLESIREYSQQVYLVEHILLTHSENDYNILTILLPSWSSFSANPAKVKELISERLPAHLTVHFRWLHASEMYDFEKIYFEWREALAAQNKEWITLTSMGLKKMLEK